MNLKFCSLSLCFTIATSIIVASSNASVSAETFVLNGNKALNTNRNFRLIDGHPRLSIWDHSINDADQNFDRRTGKKEGVLLVHRSTGKCLNAYRRFNGAEVNVYPCAPNADDPDQNFNIESLSNGEVQIRVSNTNLCIDSPTRDNGGKATVWQCVGNANQRFRINGSSTIQPPQPPQPPSTSGQITLPFKSGQTWYVCQGYKGTISHQNSFALDLSIGQDFGSTACWAKDRNVSRSANQPMLAPAGGKIYHVNSDLVCLSIDSNRSMLLGHVRDRVANGATVKQGDVLGYISAASSVNGGFSHIHLEARNSSRCAVGTSVPMTQANNFQLIGVGDLPSGNPNTYFKKALTRP